MSYSLVHVSIMPLVVAMVMLFFTIAEHYEKKAARKFWAKLVHHLSQLD